MDALQLLKQQHEKVEQLLKQYDGSRSSERQSGASAHHPDNLAAITGNDALFFYPDGDRSPFDETKRDGDLSERGLEELLKLQLDDLDHAEGARGGAGQAAGRSERRLSQSERELVGDDLDELFSSLGGRNADEETSISYAALEALIAIGE